MTGTRSKAGQELLEAFSRFRRLNWHQTSEGELRPREIMVMRFIRGRTGPDGTGVTVSEISESLGVTSPTVTQLINSMEADGYVERAADPSDRRAVRIKLTEKGQSTSQKALERFFRMFDGLAEYLGDEDSRVLTGLLGRVFEYFSLQHR